MSSGGEASQPKKKKKSQLGPTTAGGRTLDTLETPETRHLKCAAVLLTHPSAYTQKKKREIYPEIYQLFFLARAPAASVLTKYCIKTISIHFETTVLNLYQSVICEVCKTLNIGEGVEGEKKRSYSWNTM